MGQELLLHLVRGRMNNPSLERLTMWWVKSQQPFAKPFVVPLGLSNFPDSFFNSNLPFVLLLSIS